MNHITNDTPQDDDFGDEEFVEAEEWVEDDRDFGRRDFRAEDRPRGLFDQNGPIAHLLSEDGPFGKGGIFGPGGPFGNDGPFGAGGPFGPGGPFGKGGPRRGRGFSWPSDESRAFTEEFEDLGPRGGRGARGRGEHGPRGSGEHDPRGRDEHGPRGRGERHRHGQRRDFGPERGRGFDAPGANFGPQDSEGVSADATDRPRRGPRAEGPGGPRGRGPRPHERGEGRGPRGRGRRRRGDVRSAALFLIAEEPRNGYQIIEELAARTGGHWRPSSGAVYPALAQLEDEGLIEAFDNEGRKAYRLTEAGQAAVAEAGDRERPWDEAAQDAAQAFGGATGGSMWASLAQVGMAAHAVTQAGDDAMIRQATGLLDETKKALYRLLSADTSGSDKPASDAPQDATGPLDIDI